MKKYTIAIAAVALISLGACKSRTAEGANVENQGDMMSDNLNNAADSMKATADNTSNTMASDAMANAADNMHKEASNITDDAAAQADNVDAAVKSKK